MGAHQSSGTGIFLHPIASVSRCQLCSMFKTENLGLGWGYILLALLFTFSLLGSCAGGWEDRRDMPTSGPPAWASPGAWHWCRHQGYMQGLHPPRKERGSWTVLWGQAFCYHSHGGELESIFCWLRNAIPLPGFIGCAARKGKCMCCANGGVCLQKSVLIFYRIFIYLFILSL